MRFLYHPEASESHIVLSGDAHRYLFKVRRHRVNDTIVLRNLDDGYAYEYRIESIDKKTAHLQLVSALKEDISSARKFHLLWCTIEPKSVEKTLPMLNEIGVDRITFVRCDRSQHNFKLDIKRLEKILLASSQQCGRTQKMQIDFAPSLKEALKRHPQSFALHFHPTQKVRSRLDDIDAIVVGPEGGLSGDEIALFDEKKIVGLDTPMVLRSESAACAVASLLLL